MDRTAVRLAQRPLAAAGAAFAVASLLIASSARDGAWKLSKPAPSLDGRPAKLESAAQSSCAECHASIVEEWAATTHALAWTNEVYQEELADRKRADTCHGCHTPAPLHQQDLAQKPKARDQDRHFGVSCESCHLGPEGEMLGPTGAPTDAHASRRHEGFVGQGSNELCASCHKVTVGPVIGIAKDFLAEVAPLGEVGCVDCHLAPLREVDDGAGGKRVVRSHELQSLRDPAFLSRAFEFALERQGAAGRLVVSNRAGHRAPGLVGRAFEFRTRSLDAAGKELGAASLTLDTSSYLPVLGSATLDFEAIGASVEIQGWRHDPRLPKPVKFLERTLAW